MCLPRNIWIWILCFTGIESLAQVGLPGQRSGGSGGSNFEETEFVPDTLQVRYFFQKDLNNTFEFDDTLLTSFHQFDINQIQGTSYYNLGFPGSPVRKVIAVPPQFTGFALGLDHYAPYVVGDHNFRFYQSKKAITTAFYTKGKTQNDGILRIRFGRHFQDRIQLSLDYNRYVNEGLYANQRGRNTNLAAGLYYHSTDKRFHLFLSHYSNVFDQEHNGGVTTDTLFTNDLNSERATIPIELTNARSRDQRRSYQLFTTYQIGSADSSKQGPLQLQYMFKVDNQLFRYSDLDILGGESSFYQSYLTDDRGVRSFLENRRIINDFALKVGQKNNRKLTVGLKNIINRLPGAFTITEWKPYGTAGWSFADRIDIQARGELNVNKENTSFLAQGKLTLDMGSLGSVTGELDINHQRPTLLQRSHAINGIPVWDNNFKNVFINHLHALYTLPKINFRLKGGQVLINNPIYFSTLGLPTQVDGLRSLLYLSAYKQFNLGFIKTKHKVVLQKGTDHVFRAPVWYTEQSLEISSFLFKVLDLTTAFDLRVFEEHIGYTYQPTIGQFVVSDNIPVPIYPALDFRASFRVKYFRAFAILHNILQPLYQNDVYYQISDYPQQDFQFRLGISWVFIN